MSRPHDVNPEVLMSDKVQPPDVLPNRRPILAAGKPHGLRLKTLGPFRSDIVVRRRGGHPRPTTRHGCERIEAR